jgi:hypothetical protein
MQNKIVAQSSMPRDRLLSLLGALESLLLDDDDQGNVETSYDVSRGNTSTKTALHQQQHLLQQLLLVREKAAARSRMFALPRYPA